MQQRQQQQEEEVSLLPNRFNSSFQEENALLEYDNDAGSLSNLRVVLRLCGYERSKTNDFIIYIIQVCAETLGGKTWYVGKRYSQFDALRVEIKNAVKLRLNPSKVPKLPGKTFSTHLDDNFVRERAKGLSTFLWSLSARPDLINLPIVKKFLWTNIIEEEAVRTMNPTTPYIGGGYNNNSNNNAASQLQQVASFSLGENKNIPFAENTTNTNSNNNNNRSSSVSSQSEGRLQLPNAPLALQRDFELEGLTFSAADLNVTETSHATKEEEEEEEEEARRQNKNSAGDDDDDHYFDEEDEETNCWKLPFSSCSGGGEKKKRFKLKIKTFDQDLSESGLLEKQTAPIASVPALRIVIMLVGSRGDVQPYVALGKRLKQEGNHVVRIAAHECFREWITTQHGLDFAPISGDPKELLKMVVENNMFSYNFVKNGVTNHRSWVSQVLLDCWNACTLEVVSGDAERPTPPQNDGYLGPGIAYSLLHSNYRADLIIANPPSFAGWHIAEALGIPLVMSFPMPWTRTVNFPSPFTSMSGNTSANINWLSFGAVDRLIWLGIGDLVNHFRVNTLHLKPIWTLSAKGHRYVHDYKVPWIYPWSPSVLPQPKDWNKSYIHVSGYCFLEDSDGKNWEPPRDLEEFFHPNGNVIFIGFGSIVVSNPEILSKAITYVCVELAKQGEKVLFQKGWADVDLIHQSIPSELKPSIKTIGSAPHKWIFPQCKVVVHHGGAGTTAEGLRVGVPTVICPFFGDQFFWGDTIKKRKLGGTISYGTEGFEKKLLGEIVKAMQPDIKQNCVLASKGMQNEDGNGEAVRFIHKFLKTSVFIPGGHFEDGDWKIWPYYDLKKRIKIYRHQDPRGFRKLKNRFRAVLAGFTTSSSSTPHGGGLVNPYGGDTDSNFSDDADLFDFAGKTPRESEMGLEMKKVVSIGAGLNSLGNNNGGLMMNGQQQHHSSSFPFLPIHRNSTTSDLEQQEDELLEKETPIGHTNFSWGVVEVEEKKNNHQQHVPVGHSAFSWGT